MTDVIRTFCDPHEGCIPLARLREEQAKTIETALTANISASKAHARIDALLMLMIANLVAAIIAIAGIYLKR